MNRKGQALVEFVLIMPVLIFILFIIFDFGTIFSNKNNLASVSNDIVDMYKNGDSKMDIDDDYKDIDVNISKYKSRYTKITIEKDIKLVTPGIGRILPNPFPIKIERVVSDA